MSSPNIKFQCLIRKYKNGIKETIDKQKIIRDFTYQLNLEETLDISIIFNSKYENKFTYTLNDIKTDNGAASGAASGSASAAAPEAAPMPINMPNLAEELFKPDDLLFSFSPNKNIPRQQNSNFEQYTSDNGYLKTVYNAELYDRDWVIFMYFINRLYSNFSTHEKIKIKSIHIHTIPGSELSAMHHFLYNSKVNNKIPNIEWNWVGTIYNNGIRSADSHNIKKQICKKYKNNILPLFNTEISSLDNINFILNESLTKLTKANFLCADETKNHKDLIAYAILAIKLLENNCLFYLKLPSIDTWNIQIVNSLLLYSLIFSELYIFKVDIGDIKSVILLCKNKKKLAVDNSYKKLIHLLNNEDFIKSDENYNIFSADYLKSSEICEWTENILNIIQKEKDLDDRAAKPENIIFDDISYEMAKVLEMNIDTFL